MRALTAVECEKLNIYVQNSSIKLHTAGRGLSPMFKIVDGKIYPTTTTTWCIMTWLGRFKISGRMVMTVTVQ